MDPRDYRHRYPCISAYSNREILSERLGLRRCVFRRPRRFNNMAYRSAARTALAVFLCVILISLIASESGWYAYNVVPGDYTKKINVNGRRREYRLHLPSGYDHTKRLPLVLVFHGSSADAAVIERETDFDAAADSLGFVVVYPEGLHRGWNIGECCRYSFVNNVSETAFVNALLDRIEAGISIDPSRVFATGYSDGGTLSCLLACSLSQRINAVAAVSGTLFDPFPACNISRPVSVLVIHGTGDTHVPYEGRKGGAPSVRGKHQTHSSPQVVQFWVERDKCGAAPTTARSGRVIRTEYNCADSTNVLFYSIDMGEHGWPGGERGWVFSPVPPRDMNATDSIAGFFLRQRPKA